MSNMIWVIVLEIEIRCKNPSILVLMAKGGAIKGRLKIRIKNI